MPRLKSSLSRYQKLNPENKKQARKQIVKLIESLEKRLFDYLRHEEEANSILWFMGSNSKPSQFAGSTEKEQKAISTKLEGYKAILQDSKN